MKTIVNCCRPSILFTRANNNSTATGFSLKFIFALAAFCVISFTQSHAQQTAKITSSGIGYLEYLPEGYATNANDYPVVIFLHGIGEKGTTSTDPATIKSSLLKVANVGLARYIKYGTQYPFIVISPQLKSNYGTWPASYVIDVLNYVKKTLRINERRIYITGLSLGGFGTWTTLAAYPDVFAAALPICSGGNALSKACAISASNVPVWGFHATDDKVVSYTVTTKMVNAINGCTPKPTPLAKTTLFPTGGHAIWDRVYKQTEALNWLVSYTNGTTASTSDTNSLPIVSAGSDKSITLPTNEVYIQGTASDSDGSIASYSWSKISGGMSSISGNATSKLRAYNLVEGTYIFRLTVKDDKGASKYDDVKVTVLASSTTNVLPTSNAGADKTTSSSTVTLYGSGTDKDGKIVSYKWEKYYGGSVTLTNSTSPTVTVSGMTDGKYFLRLLVTDDKGGSDYDYMNIVVSGSTTTTTTATATTTSTSINIAPVADAGNDRTTIYTAITIVGSGSDKDGSVSSYKWTQTGGAACRLKNENTSKLIVSELKDGKYSYRLTVRDDDGATGSDEIIVTVSGSGATTSTAGESDVTTPNIAPVANAGPDKRIDGDPEVLKLYGSGYDKDGKIVSYKWTQFGGADLALRNANSPTLTISGMEAGRYYFKLTVRDDDGAVAHDKMYVLISES